MGKFRNSILKRLQVYMILFGIFMGMIFPVFANFFVVWKEGMFAYFVIGCMVAGITVGVVSFHFVKVILIRKLLHVSGVANEVSNGKLGKTIEIKSDDAVGVIINGLNSSVISMREFLEVTRNTCNITSELLVKIKKDNNRRFDINNINQSVNIVSEVTRLISKQSEKSLELVNKSKKAIILWQEQLTTTITNVDKLTNVMNSLVLNSEKIDNIMNIIEDIAGRTSLVSVNASIEANHAGTYGKSFSVVAGEIGTLARNVNSSAMNISGYIQQIHSDIENAGHSLGSIEGLVSGNCNNSKEISGQLMEIERMSRSNRDVELKLVRSVENLNNAFKSIDSVINQLSGNTHNLQQVVNSYSF